MLRWVFPFQQFGDGWHKIISYRAANAAIIEFNNIVLGATLNAAAFQHFAIHAQITKFIDDKRNTSAICCHQHIADQCGFAGTQKSGDNGCRNFLCVHNYLPI